MKFMEILKPVAIGVAVLVIWIVVTRILHWIYIKRPKSRLAEPPPVHVRENPAKPFINLADRCAMTTVVSVGKTTAEVETRKTRNAEAKKTRNKRRKARA